MYVRNPQEYPADWISFAPLLYPLDDQKLRRYSLRKSEADLVIHAIPPQPLSATARTRAEARRGEPLQLSPPSKTQPQSTHPSPMEA